MLPTKMDCDLFKLDDALTLVTKPTGIPNYDFDFRSFFPCRHPFDEDRVQNVIARCGAFEDYRKAYTDLHSEGVELIHTPDEHARCSTLPGWYPLLSGLTPESFVYMTPPRADEVERLLGWPVFMKGTRQTSRHQRAMSIVKDRADFAKAIHAWGQDPILGWQPLVCRRYVPLRPVEDPDPERIPSSFEFRCFFWRGQLVGSGRYWWQEKAYTWTEAEKDGALRVARDAAARVGVPFLVVDVACAASGSWLVIECNDGQESGFAGISPFALWQSIIEAEREFVK